MKKYTVYASGSSHVGLVRSNNEDRIYVNGNEIEHNNSDNNFGVYEESDSHVNIYAIFDGMGGEADGGIAALIGLETLCQFRPIIKSCDLSDLDKCIENYIEHTNDVICNRIRENNANMGTTISLACLYGNKLKVYNLGDSRAYLFRESGLIQLSHDHTVTQQLIDANLISIEEARNHPKRNKLTQHIGVFKEEFIIEPHISEEIELQHDDIVILCSDGLTDMCSDSEISEIILDSDNLNSTVNRLLQKALENGGKDNISVIMIQAVNHFS